MKLICAVMVVLFTQVSYGYSCQERIVFMYVFKVQSLITQKIKGADSLKEAIAYCQSELASVKDEAKKAVADCDRMKFDAAPDDKLIEEMYPVERDTVMLEEKQFAHDLTDKYRKNLDVLKLCRDYGKDSPYIKSKLVP